MAIIIPSRNIYSKSFDPVIDNNIDKIEVSVKEILPDNRYDESVFNDKFINGTNTQFVEEQMQSDQNVAHRTYGGTLTSTASVSAFSYVSVIPIYLNVGVRIDKNAKNQKISQLNLGTDEDGNAEIKYSISGETQEGTVENTVALAGTADNPTATFNPANNQYSDPTIETGSYQISDDDKNLENIEKYTYASTTEQCIAKIDFADSENIKDPMIIQDDENVCIIGLKLLVGLKTVKIGVSNHYVNYASSAGFSSTATVTGTYKNYIPAEVQITIYGNTIGIDMQDKTVTIGDGNNVYSFDGNELIQAENNYAIIFLEKMFGGLIPYPYFIVKNNVEVKVGDKIQYQNEILTVKSVSSIGLLFDNTSFGGDLANGTIIVASLLGKASLEDKYKNIIQEWKNGKQTATISCPIADYYDENGNKVIDTSVSGKMLFQDGDIVIPYIYTNKGDKPISYNRDFTPKQFKVVGTKISKKQGGTQELTLVEA